MRIITLVHKLYYTVRTSPLTLAVPYSTPCGSKTKYYYSLYVLFRSRYILLKLIVILYCTPYFTGIQLYGALSINISVNVAWYVYDSLVVRIVVWPRGPRLRLLYFRPYCTVAVYGPIRVHVRYVLYF